MIANIRIRDSGKSRFLCELDLMRFSEEQVRERMKERGINDDTFFVCGFFDWQVDNEMSLELAYALKRSIQELYDGNEEIVVSLLKRHISVIDIISHYYRFISKDEHETLLYLLEHTTIGQFMISKAVKDGILVNTKNGFYIADNNI
ncbi:hypothetical protein [Streptococcus equinus]|uniref:hypothetical protein n=1 Tax=Streptococcus equinus TaxID=1335 RepID=UPI00051B5054|nr:hypothetical protein [Streptococcus equinus]